MYRKFIKKYLILLILFAVSSLFIIQDFQSRFKISQNNVTAVNLESSLSEILSVSKDIELTEDIVSISDKEISVKKRFEIPVSQKSKLNKITEIFSNLAGEKYKLAIKINNFCDDHIDITYIINE